MDLAYRSLEHVAAERLEALAAERREHASELDRLAGIYARRVARTAAGATMLVIVVPLFVAAYVIFVRVLFHRPTMGLCDGALTALLLAAWPASAFAYAIGRATAAARAKTIVDGPTLRTGRASVDLARLRDHDPARRLVALTMRRERSSIALPLMALSFAMPLTLHLAFSLALNITSIDKVFGANGFDAWILLSVAIVGHAHVALAVCAFRYATGLVATDSEFLSVRKHDGWLRAWGVTALAAALPGVVLIAIPPILVLVTGIVFIPPAWLVMRSRIAKERAALAVRAATRQRAAFAR